MEGQVTTSPDDEARSHPPGIDASEVHYVQQRALLIDAISRRQTRGEATTLRDLHRLLDVVQPVALRLAYRLEREGLVLVEEDATDAFAASITVIDPLDQERSHGRRPLRAD